MDHFGNLLNHSHGVTQAGLLKEHLSPNHANFTWLLDNNLCKTVIPPRWSSCSKIRRDVIPLEFTSKGVRGEHTAVKLKQNGKAIQTKCQHTQRLRQKKELQKY